MIREIIVVEGKHDTTAIRRAVQADTIETGGSAIHNDVLAQIAKAQQLRGVIILTDPDHAGERIRRIVADRVPGCKHAFVAQLDATHSGDIGIENASPESIRNALAQVRTEAQSPGTDLTVADLTLAGLAGVCDAAQKRFIVGRRLRIGYANAKTFLKRCAMFGIRRSDLDDVLAACGWARHFDT